MTTPEELFYKIAKEIPDAQEGKMFGAKCIKSNNGKTAAIFWKNNMMFKLNKQDQDEALKMDGAKIGFHLYAPERPMKGWVEIQFKHADQWMEFAKKAIAFVQTLKK